MCTSTLIQVKPLTRFLCDTSLSGGAWLYIPSQGSTGVGYTAVSVTDRASCCDVEVVAPWKCLESLTPDATQLADTTWQPEVNGASWDLVMKVKVLSILQ